jgi:hypothetical protein
MSLSETPQPVHQPDPDPKDVAFYSAVVSAWIETKMERDKTIVTLSAGAIGLLVTLLTTVGVKTPWAIWLYAGAFAGFGVAAICTIVIFHRNATYLEKVVQGTMSESTRLGWLDRITLTFFGLGIIFTILIGATGLLSGVPMKEQIPKSQSSKDTLAKSLNGIQNLKPQLPAMPVADPRSLNGIQNLKPQTGGVKPASTQKPDSGHKAPTAKVPKSTTKKP